MLFNTLLTQWLLSICTALALQSSAVCWAASSDSLLSARQPSKYPDLLYADISDLKKGLDTGRWTSVDLVKAYIARIDEVNKAGPKLNAVTEVATTALQQAKAADAARKAGKAKGSLHGIPIIVKDNIATDIKLGMNTTAGSYSLVNSVPPRNAYVAQNLLDSGAIILGKASLSVWAFYRGSNLTQGWSPRAGFVTSAWYPGASACSSSAGSGVIASIGLAAGTLGSETDGSIVCPSHTNGVVGIKPTVDSKLQQGVIPISSNQDSPGPIVNSVSDAAIILSSILGKGAPDFTKVLKKNGLKGARIGVVGGKFVNATYQGYDPSVVGLYYDALAVLKKQGATLVNVTIPSVESNEYDESQAESTVLKYDIKADMAKYLQGLVSVPTGVRSLKDLIDFANANPELELPGRENTQDLFTDAEATSGLDAQEYKDAVAKDRRLGATEGIDATLKKFNVDVLVGPSPSYLYSIAAIVGYPALSVPMGYMSAKAAPIAGEDPPFPFPRAPSGLAFIGTAHSEAKLLQYGYAYEQATLWRQKRRPQFAPKTQLQDVI